MVEVTFSTDYQNEYGEDFTDYPNIYREENFYIAKGFKENFELVFNLDGDLIFFSNENKSKQVFISERGQINGLVDIRSLYNGQINEVLSNGNFKSEMAPDHLNEVKKYINTGMEILLEAYPDHIIINNYFSGITKDKQSLFKKMTDNIPLILPADAIERKYNLAKIIVNRGCGKKNMCKGCKTGGDKRYQKSKIEIESQIDYYIENYPNTLHTYSGLLIGGEDPLLLETDLIVHSLNYAAEKLNFSAFEEQHNSSITTMSENPGFAYTFGGLKTLSNMDVKELRRCANEGLKTVNAGLESALKSIMETKFPKFTIAEAERGIANCKEAGLDLSLNVILGFGEDDEKHLNETLEFLRHTNFNGKIYLSRYINDNGTYQTELSDFLDQVMYFINEYEHSQLISFFPIVYL